MEPTYANKWKVYKNLGGFSLFTAALLAHGFYLLIIQKNIEISNECKDSKNDTVGIIVSIMDLVFGFILFAHCFRLTFFTYFWVNGRLDNTRNFKDIYRSFDDATYICLAILQMSVIGFTCTRSIREYDKSDCPDKLFYPIFYNIYVVFNICLLIGSISLVISCIYMLSYMIYVLITQILEKIIKIAILLYLFVRYCRNFEIIHTKYQSIVSHFSNFSTVRPGNHSTSTNNQRLNIHSSNIQIITDSVIIHIPEIIETNLSYHQECPICLETKETGCKLKNCSHWVCEECWPKMNNNNCNSCPLCRASNI